MTVAMWPMLGVEVGHDREDCFRKVGGTGDIDGTFHLTRRRVAGGMRRFARVAGEWTQDDRKRLAMVL